MLDYPEYTVFDCVVRRLLSSRIGKEKKIKHTELKK